jgi:hypothetical protein
MADDLNQTGRQDDERINVAQDHGSELLEREARRFSGSVA